MSEFLYDKILTTACMAGRILLENGGEVYRVEQTICNICKVYGAQCSDSFATPTGLIISITDENGKTYSRLQRITKRKVDLHKVERISNFSRLLSEEKLPLSETCSRLEQIDALKPYSLPVITAAAAVGSGAFAIVFGGGIKEFFCALIVGALLRLLTWYFAYISLGDFFINMTGGAIAAFMGWVIVFIVPDADRWIITLSALMLLVPGMLITNSFRDIAAGDLVSGVSRGSEAFCIAAALACGAAFVFTAFLL